MKKIFTILIALLAVVGAEARTILPNGKTFDSKGDQVTTLADLYDASLQPDQLFILQNYGYPANSDSRASFYAQPTSGTNLRYEAEGALDQYSLVKLNITRSGEEGSYTYQVSVQSLNGQYYQGPINNNINNTNMTIGDNEVKFALSLPTSRSASEFWFSYSATVNSTNYTWHFNNNGNTPNWHQPGAGAWSRTNIYKANLRDAQESDLTSFSITSYYAPEGTTYKIGDTDLTITETNGIGTGTFSAIPGSVSDSYVTVTPSEGYGYFAVFSGTTYSIYFTKSTTVSISDQIGKKVTFSESATSIETDKWYLLYQNRDGGGYAYNNNGNYNKKAVSNFTSGTELTADNEVYLFKFVPVPTETEGVYYIQNADGTFFGNGSSGTIPATNVGYQYNVKAVENNDGYFYLQCLSTSALVDNNDYSGDNATIVWWGTTIPTNTGNNTWQLYPVNFVDEVFTVTWNVSYSGADGTTKTLSDVIRTEVAKGGTATVPTSTYPFTTYTTTEDLTNITSAKTINATAEFSTPFTASTDYSSAKWYYIRNGNSDGTTGNSNDYIYYSANNTTSIPAQTSVSNTKAFKWAFIGNPIDGYKVINKEAGETMSVYAASTSDMPHMSTTEGKWYIETGQSLTVGGVSNTTTFGMSLDKSNKSYWNWQNKQIKYWTTSTGDKGSCWAVEEAPENETADLTAYNTALAAAKNIYNNATVGTGLGEYSGSTKDALNTVISTYGSKTTSDSQDDVDAATTALTNAVNAFTLNTPKAGQFLQISSYAKDCYASGNQTAGNSVLGKVTEDTNGDTYWYYDGTGLLSYSSGLYLNSTISPMFGSSTEQSVTFAENADYHKGDGVYTISVNGQYLYLLATHGKTVDRNSSLTPPSSSEGNFLNLTEITTLPITMHKATKDGKYYATIYLPVAVTLPEGTSAYIITSANNGSSATGTATLTEIAANDGTGVVPAKTGVVLVGAKDATEDVTTINLTVTVGGTASTVDGNYLLGTYIAKTPETTGDVTNDYYFGQTSANGAGFYKADLANASSTVYITNKAYLPYGNVTTSDETSGSKGFTFVFGDDDPTGISTATATDEIMENSVRYNLQGQRVDAGYKGIVIIGGKKYLIK